MSAYDAALAEARARGVAHAMNDVRSWISHTIGRFEQDGIRLDGHQSWASMTVLLEELERLSAANVSRETSRSVDPLTLVLGTPVLAYASPVGDGDAPAYEGVFVHVSVGGNEVALAVLDVEGARVELPLAHYTFHLASPTRVR